MFQRLFCFLQIILYKETTQRTIQLHDDLGSSDRNEMLPFL